MINNEFDQEYFENGTLSGKSCYDNYSWLPELTIKMAFNILKHLDLKDSNRVLDYGCAKGFLVKAFRLLDIDAYGCDISDYAISKIDADVRGCCHLIDSEKNTIPFDKNFDWVITKDVLEHIPEDKIDNFLQESRKKAKKCFHVIPLGTNSDKYIIPEYELDKTHVLAKSKDWWIERFAKHGWVLKDFQYNIKGVKDKWTDEYEFGNGFFIFE